MRGCRRCAEIATEGIRSIAVDGWAVDYVRLGEDGRPLGDPFCYRDLRTVEAEAWLHERIAPERLREITAIQPMPDQYALSAGGGSGCRVAGGSRMAESAGVSAVSDGRQACLRTHDGGA